MDEKLDKSLTHWAILIIAMTSWVAAFTMGFWLVKQDNLLTAVGKALIAGAVVFLIGRFIGGHAIEAEVATDEE